jgi:hypothetical protein
MSFDRIQLNSEFNGNPEGAYDFFVANSTWYELPQGGSAIIYILILKRGIVSPYTTLAGIPINKILVKISIIDENKNYYYHGNPVFMQTIKNIQGISKLDFTNEVDIQRYVVEQTLQFNNPLSAIILCSNILQAPDSKLSFLQTIYNDNLGKKNRANIIAGGIATPLCGMVAMEYVESMTSVGRVLGEFIDVRWGERMDPNHISGYIGDRVEYSEEVSAILAVFIHNLILLASIGIAHGDGHIDNGLAKNIEQNKNKTKKLSLSELIESIEVLILDFGRSKRITPEEQAEVERLLANFRKWMSLNSLKKLVFYIMKLNDIIFRERITGHSDEVFFKFIFDAYAWFVDERILAKILPHIIEADRQYMIKLLQQKKSSTSLILPFPSSGFPSQNFLVLDPNFAAVCIASSSTQKEKRKTESDDTHDTQLFKSSASSDSPESESSQSSVSSTESDKAKRDKIAEGRRLLQIAIDSGQYSFSPPLTKKTFEKELKARFPVAYKLLIGNERHGYKDDTEDDRLINLADVNASKRPGHSTDSQALLIALIYPNFFPEPMKGGAASPSQLEPELQQIIPVKPEPELQQIIPVKPEYKLQLINLEPVKPEPELQQIIPVKPEYKLQQIILEPVKPEDKTFAEWRDAIYKKYTEPNAAKREEYYSKLTPFAILIHVMVCCGLFGPLTSGQYINVDESHPQYNQLNSIAAAFSTMNNGYISMTRMRLETMMPSLGNRSVSAVDPTMVNVDVDNTKSINLEEANALEAYGGKPKRQTKRLGKRRKNKKKTWKTKKNKKKTWKTKKNK